MKNKLDEDTKREHEASTIYQQSLQHAVERTRSDALQETVELNRRLNHRQSELELQSKREKEAYRIREDALIKDTSQREQALKEQSKRLRKQYEEKEIQKDNERKRWKSQINSASDETEDEKKEDQIIEQKRYRIDK
ncbi:MAG: hypothetical protein EZS28_001086 [Streblomastix strix]|uniref:Uncharacterized protein n=1 Tax=Streblomastix strix TaxID=222440 RepID=A0A5J4X907_9EUKA|nr:MAG: hypothetical protein EZS28_001086 [Streblomastix strix]